MHFLAPFVTLLVSWSIDFTDPDVQRTITYIFIVVHVAMFAAMMYIFVRIWASNDMRTLTVKDQYTNEMQPTTTAGYDFSKWRDLLFTKLGMPVAVGFLIASRWNTPFPLLLQCVSNPGTLYNHPLFQLHALGRPEEAKLARPWKEDSVMPEWMQKMWQQGQSDEESFLSGSNGESATKTKRRRLGAAS